MVSFFGMFILDAFILIFQTRSLRTCLLYVIYQNNPVDCSLIGFSVVCCGTVKKKKEKILAGHSFPSDINLRWIDLKTTSALILVSFLLHCWEKWKCNEKDNSKRSWWECHALSHRYLVIVTGAVDLEVLRFSDDCDTMAQEQSI